MGGVAYPSLYFLYFHKNKKMIYLNNDSTIQQVYIPRQTINKVTTINPDDLKDYATESWVRAQGYATKTWVGEQHFADEDDLKSYYTKAEVDDIVDDFEATDLSDYYTKNEVNQLIDDVEVDLSDYYNKTEINTKVEGLETDINSKQPALVSGENIKTINGQNILGSGNITIEGGDIKVIEMNGDRQIVGQDIVDSAEVLKSGKPVILNTPWGMFGLTGGNSNENDYEIYANIPFYGDNNMYVRLKWYVSNYDGNWDGVDLTQPKFYDSEVMIFPAQDPYLGISCDINGNMGADSLLQLMGVAQFVRLELFGENSSYKTTLNWGEDNGTIHAYAIVNGTTLYSWTCGMDDWGQEISATITTIGGGSADLEGYATEEWVSSNFIDNTGLKTINGQSLIGSGDIAIGDGGTVDLSDYVEKDSLATINGQVLYNGGNIVIEGGGVVDENECIVIQYVGDYTVKNQTQGTSTTYKYSGSDRQQHNLEMIQKILQGDTRAVYYQLLLEQVYRNDENGDYVNPPTWIVMPVTYRYPSHDGLARFMGVVEKNEYASPDGVYSIGIVLNESTASLYANNEYKLKDYFAAGGVDLSGYATEEWVNNKGYVTKSSMNSTLKSYYTKTEVDSLVGDINTLLASI